jgi:hypothetical protein
MSLSVNIDKNQKLICLTCSDIISVNDLIEYEHEYWADPEMLSFNQIIDFSNALWDVEFSELFLLATNATAQDDSITGLKTYLVVADSVQTELAEFYRDTRHEICPAHIREIVVSLDIEEALSALT